MKNGIPMLTVCPDAAGFIRTIPKLTVCPDAAGFIRTIPKLTPDPHHAEDVDTTLEDHVYDAARYAMMSDFATYPSRYIAGANRTGPVIMPDWDPMTRRK